MATAEERLLAWLRDAHAMEQQAEQMLTAQAARIDHYPELKAQIERHIEETRDQARLVRSCIERRGGSPSMIKDTTGKVMAMAQGLGGLFAGDEVMKGSLASYTFEHMEIGSYTMLIAAAETVGDAETARICRQILGQEEAMAAWLAQHLPVLTRTYLDREEAPGVTAKR